MGKPVSFLEAVIYAKQHHLGSLPENWECQAMVCIDGYWLYANLVHTGNYFTRVDVFSKFSEDGVYTWRKYIRIFQNNDPNFHIIVDKGFSRYERYATMLDLNEKYITISSNGSINYLTRPWREDVIGKNPIVFNPNENVKFFKKVDSK